MKKLGQSNVTTLYLVKSSIEIVIIDSPCVERISLICKVAVSCNSDLPHSLNRRRVNPFTV